MPVDQFVEVPVDRDSRIRTLVAGLARPHPSGGQVVERASLLASGDAFRDVLAWIDAHGGEPEFAPVVAVRPGLHRLRDAETATGDNGGTPQRFVLPAAALSPAPTGRPSPG